ncbi:hypothetical protein CKAH01_04018 [Colletotrichum kahawae]|uniref:Uncharacterized protein n=1 Tax=Colletotrichum kahawae TaxID=34407 RepID=A0AAD9YME3_COLKA|nr:hypothetical protein CKAH01_04018 [Colletotrichum kahawae]
MNMERAPQRQLRAKDLRRKGRKPTYLLAVAAAVFKETLGSFLPCPGKHDTLHLTEESRGTTTGSTVRIQTGSNQTARVPGFALISSCTTAMNVSSCWKHCSTTRCMVVVALFRQNIEQQQMRESQWAKPKGPTVQDLRFSLSIPLP